MKKRKDLTVDAEILSVLDEFAADVRQRERAMSTTAPAMRPIVGHRRRSRPRARA